MSKVAENACFIGVSAYVRIYESMALGIFYIKSLVFCVKYTSFSFSFNYGSIIAQMEGSAAVTLTGSVRRADSPSAGTNRKKTGG